MLLLGTLKMDAPIKSLLFVLATFAVLFGVYSYWLVRRQRAMVRVARSPESPTHGPWLPTPSQMSSCLLHEERYFLKAALGRKGAHQVLCEERYSGRLSGAVIASRPPRPIAEAKSLSEGRELLNFFHEVSSSGERAA